ncbi:AraC family transcriptional regulator [Vibrio fluvialis]|uniref:AraC family transcriptional regulator n=1 Tax=Vibrio fluvialis TaxID=676 RepID=UPI001C9CC4E7|nr:AraC family transcriptional regulator [Vibrio fluvialis]MBY7764291.1 AraC family transcriptional regulator [Vibrio fluvialis]MBY7773113.1 AraC family transcriptional regulator [Vibrio fluvialis]MBY7776981.1 AraC family transcriptional regulator [Vibrio fluvialis]MBY7986515.1 AraC family transcriptional regulator [Vibrio fluvialis]MBY7990813.1 AraC family transcriptional regulator [Vibrio fluvialis]
MKTLNSFRRIDETEYALSTDKVNMLYYHLPKHFQGEYRSYETPRLCTILQGSKDVRINQSQQFTYRKEQCVLLPPHANVHMSMSEFTKALVYEFSEDVLQDVSARVGDQLEVKASLDRDYSHFQMDYLQDRIYTLHGRAQEILRSNDSNIPFLLDLVTQEMVYELLKRQGSHEILSQHQHHPVNRAIRMMKAHLGEPLSISELAEEVRMSLPNFSQKFKLVTNQTPKEYFTRLKLNQSKRYLNQLSVTDTALELGYENISHFIRLFKKEFGVTPKQFKLSQELTH